MSAKAALKNSRAWIAGFFLVVTGLFGGGMVTWRSAEANTCICSCYPTCPWWGPCLCEVWSPDALSGWESFGEDIIEEIESGTEDLLDKIQEFGQDLGSTRSKQQEALAKAMANDKNFMENMAAIKTPTAAEITQQFMVERIGMKPAQESANDVANAYVAASKVWDAVGNATRAEIDNALSFLSNEPHANKLYGYNLHAGRYCTHVEMIQGQCIAAGDNMRAADLIPPVFAGDDHDETATQHHFGAAQLDAARAWMIHVMGAGRYPMNNAMAGELNAEQAKAFEARNNTLKARASVFTGAMAAQIRRRTQNIVAFDFGSGAPAGAYQSVTQALGEQNPLLGGLSFKAGESASTEASKGFMCSGKPSVAGGRAEVDAAINAAYDASNLSSMGVDRESFHRYALMASAKNPEVARDSSSPYKGLYRLHESAVFGTVCGGGDIYDPVANATCSARYAEQNWSELQKLDSVYGVSPAQALYMSIQQGAGGFAKIYRYVLTGTEPPAGDALRENMVKSMPGSVSMDMISVKQWWSHWKSKFTC